MLLDAKRQTYQRGLKAETLAVWYLRLKGYQILERRYKTKVGEVDIIAHYQNQIIFVEVKARPTVAQALESVTPTMKRRIEKTALTYIAEQRIIDKDYRFDVIAVLPFYWRALVSGKLFIRHLDNAWMTSA